MLDERWSRPVAPPELAAAVSGRAIRGLGRRGKYLLLALDGGADPGHAPADDRQPGPGRGGGEARPSEGRRLYEGERSTSSATCAHGFALDDGRELWFTDPRRFGEAFLIDDADLPRVSSGSGSSRSPTRSRRSCSVTSLPGVRRRSSRFCWTSRGSLGSAISMPTSLSSGRAYTHSLPLARCAPSTSRRCATRCSPRC